MNITKLFKAGKSRLFYAINGRPICEGCAYDLDGLSVVSAPINTICVECGFND
jgi:hypothetical protein